MVIFSALFLLTSFRELEPVFILDGFKTVFWQVKKSAWIGVLVVGVWQAVAMNTIIYISGLQTVPQEVYEASMLDGASKWKEFFSVTLPLVIPFVTINLVLSTKNLLMVFDQIMSLTKGGPAQSTESISYLIYKMVWMADSLVFQSANAVLFLL